jgi:hypothetical protein
METAFFLLDALAMTLLVFTSLQNDKRRPGEKLTGIFRFSEKRVDSGSPSPGAPSTESKDRF